MPGHHSERLTRKAKADTLFSTPLLQVTDFVQLSATPNLRDLFPVVVVKVGQPRLPLGVLIHVRALVRQGVVHIRLRCSQVERSASLGGPAIRPMNKWTMNLQRFCLPEHLPFYGMWADRDDIIDGVSYVNALRNNPRG